MPPRFTSVFFNGRSLTFRLEELRRLEELKVGHPDTCNKCSQRFELFRLGEKRLCLGCWFDEAHATHKIQTHNNSLVCEVCHGEQTGSTSLTRHR